MTLISILNLLAQQNLASYEEYIKKNNIDCKALVEERLEDGKLNDSAKNEVATHKQMQSNINLP